MSPEDLATLERVQSITDASSFVCLRAERGLARALDASCHTPLGAHAITIDHDHLLLRAWIGLPDGSPSIADELSDQPQTLRPWRGSWPSA